MNNNTVDNMYMRANVIEKVYVNQCIELERLAEASRERLAHIQTEGLKSMIRAQIRTIEAQIECKKQAIIDIQSIKEKAFE